MGRRFGNQVLWMVAAVLMILSITCFQSEAQAVTSVTDPVEIQVLKNLSEKYNLNDWTFDADPCGPVGQSIYVSYLKCVCTFNNGSTCHVVQMYIFEKNMRGLFPIDVINLKHLTYLDFGRNFLHGSLPPELGTLTGLTHFAVGTNFFSGRIPPDLGNLTNLIDLYLDSNYFSGEIPIELARLNKLTTLWLLDNNLSGSIPEIFGNMKNLSNLRIYGNSLDGPIPLSIKNLTGINQLYIGDLSNGGSFPSGLENLYKLSELSLRNNGLTGSIPLSLGSMTTLNVLDLSFNNLSGPIPPNLGNLISLRSLYLEGNKLVGDVPEGLSQSKNLTTLDLSFNQLQGSIPLWLQNGSSLDVNLIWNSFNASMQYNGSKSTLPLLNCSNQNRTCVGINNENSFFAINVGGFAYNQNSVTYDADNSNLGSASVYLNPSRTWLVSSSGQATIVQSTVSIEGSPDPVLFLTARQSLSSLRYFGLGMKNGQYTIELQFAEISFADGSYGRRIFDIYIQGDLVLKNFNIQKAANGSYKHFTQPLKAEISNHLLEIHFFWSGKGTCCIPNYLASYGPLVSAIRVYSDASAIQQSPGPRSKNSGISVGAIAGISVGVFMALACGIFIFMRRRRRQHLRPPLSEVNTQEFISFQGAPTIFSYIDLRIATNNFHSNNKLGEGGFGSVYKGVLQDGSVVAIKELSAGSKQGNREFMNEVTLITGVQHRNLVRLRGCCLEGDRRLVVYEYLENKSLDKILFDPREASALNWRTRFNIIIGTARGLAYLHEESQARIIHRDIKASNILLDNKLQPKIADFGLARLFVDDASHVSTGVAGTIGYLAPEYAFRGQLTEKADIYSFGVVVLEVISGRKNTNSKLSAEKEFLLDWTWHLYENNRLLDLPDPLLTGEYAEEEMLQVIHVSLLCVQATASMRPAMTRVVSMLLGDVEIGVMPSKPSFLGELGVLSRKYTPPICSTTSAATSSSSSSALGLSYPFSGSSSSANEVSLSVIEPR